MTLNGTIEYASSVACGAPLWSGPGLFRWQSGRMNGFTFGPGFQVEMTGTGAKGIGGTCTNQGTIRWLGDSALNSGGTGVGFLNTGLFTLEANCNTDGGIIFSNLPGGILRVLGGQSSFVTVDNTGLVEFNGGVLNVNGFGSGPGAQCHWTLAGYGSGADFGTINAQGLLLDGMLAVFLTNNFAPTNGASFVLATDTFRTGRFTRLSLPALSSNLNWRVQYEANALTLKVVGPTTLAGGMRMLDGTFQLTLNGAAASGYEIQASTNLVNWFTIETNGPFAGTLIFTDTNASHFERRFYRARIVE